MNWAARVFAWMAAILEELTADMEKTAELDYRECLPGADEYLALFETTGWNREYHLSAEDLHEAIRHSWYLIAAYDRETLVATGRVVSDGVFHAFIVDVIVSPEYQAQRSTCASFCGTRR